MAVIQFVWMLIRLSIYNSELLYALLIIELGLRVFVYLYLYSIQHSSANWEYFLDFTGVRNSGHRCFRTMDSDNPTSLANDFHKNKRSLELNTFARHRKHAKKKKSHPRLNNGAAIPECTATKNFPIFSRFWLLITWVAYIYIS